MKRHVFLSFTIAFVIASSSTLIDAQQTAKTLPRIGFIYSTGAPGTVSLHSTMFDSFQQGLTKLGYVEGKNILIERRYAEGRLDRMPPLVNEFVQRES